jgi:hypothetical protein
MDVDSIKLVHAIPGRVRVKIPRVKNDPNLANELREKFSAVRGIRQVEANPLTGSVLVLYDTSATETFEFLPALSEAFSSVFPDADLIGLDGSENHSSNGAKAAPLANRVSAFLGALDARVEQAAGGSVDLRFLVPLSLVLLGIARLVMAKRVPFPAWYDFFWFAFGTFIALNPPGSSRSP